jgi:hypothetical protein
MVVLRRESATKARMNEQFATARTAPSSPMVGEEARLWSGSGALCDEPTAIVVRMGADARAPISVDIKAP